MQTMRTIPGVSMHGQQRVMTTLQARPMLNAKLLRSAPIRATTDQNNRSHLEMGAVEGLNGMIKRAGVFATSTLLTASLLLGGAPGPAHATKVVRSSMLSSSYLESGLLLEAALSLQHDDQPGSRYRLPASNNPEIFEAQRTMVEAWTIVGESFVDPEFNAHDWPEELQRHMVAAYASDTPRKAWDEINSMLSELGDPYTRRIEPEEYQAFRVSTDGQLQGVGLLIAEELSSSGHLRVLAPIRGGPAERAGILPGDEVLSINGQDTKGWKGEQVAKALRGQGGTEVSVKLARRTDGIPGVASRPEPPFETAEPAYTYKELSLRREAVVISPVYATLLSGSSSTISSDSESAVPSVKLPVATDLHAAPIGYVRLSQFSNNAAHDMRKALSDLQGQGARRYILDLRSNPGGLVKAGVDVAALWLDGEQVVFTVASRDDGLQVQTTETRSPALTHDPLVVLVDGMSASASEIVSGALHDNHRAVVMGDVDHTYGKGRIQSVYELNDGSALFVTVAKYRTPGGSDIDQRGIHPDKACRSMPAVLPTPSLTTASSQQGGTSTTATTRPLMTGAPMMVRNYENDSNSAKATNATNKTSIGAGMGSTDEPSGFMPGVPLDRPTEALLMEALTRDRCVLAAAQYLETVENETSNDYPPLTPAQTLYLALIDGERATL